MADKETDFCGKTRKGESAKGRKKGGYNIAGKRLTPFPLDFAFSLFRASLRNWATLFGEPSGSEGS
jgi:hypothetical protein